MILCNYGCGKEAKFTFKNGKSCCSNNIAKCPTYRNINSKSKCGPKNPMFGIDKTKNPSSRPEVIEKIRSKLKGRSKLTHEYIKKAAEKLMGKTKENNEGRKKAAEKLTGRTKLTHEGVRRRAENQKGKTKETHEYIKIRSEKIAEKIRGRTKETHDGIRRQAEKISGENNPSWNPNRNEVFSPYTELFYSIEYRERIKKDQKNLDPVTNELLTEMSCLHHIDYNKQNDSRENLIWLNSPIHSKTNFNRLEWEQYLNMINLTILENRERHVFYD